MKIGLLFGSFDPIHIGHISIATNIINEGLVDEVVVITAWKNPWKCTVTPYKHRISMVQEAFDVLSKGLAFTKLEGKVRVSPIESSMAGKHPSAYLDGVPTYAALKELKELHTRDEVYIITTVETYNEMPKWERAEEILNNKFILVNFDRNHYLCSPDGDIDNLRHAVFMPRIQICSTAIRERLQKGWCVFPYVTSEVQHYINKHNLYKK